MDKSLSNPVDVRQAIRAGEYNGLTSGIALGYVQANLCILPADYAGDFLRYCQRNPKPCPLLCVSEVGDPTLLQLGSDLDVRTDLCQYDVFRHGLHAETVTDLLSLWRDDFVTFAMGCSYSFEHALVEGGVPLRHLDLGLRPARYNTNVDTVAAGPFEGHMVVTMRPFKPVDAIKAIQITSRFPSVHGAPVHLGSPHLIGIDDLVDQCETDLVPLEPDDVLLFWGCGVTPQLAIERARPEICITHRPGYMLVTDRLNSSLAVF